MKPFFLPRRLSATKHAAASKRRTSIVKPARTSSVALALGAAGLLLSDIGHAQNMEYPEAPIPGAGSLQLYRYWHGNWPCPDCLGGITSLPYYGIDDGGGFSWGYGPWSDYLPGSGGMSFSLQNVGDAQGGGGFVDSTARISGYQDGTLEIVGTQITFDGPYSIKGDLDMHGHKIINLHDGDIGPDSGDAINGSQIYNIYVRGMKYFHAFSDRDAASATGQEAVAIGPVSSASGKNALALGSDSIASADDTVALGGSATASAINSVAIGYGAIADRLNTVSVGSPGYERQINSVGAGVSGTDAINVDQLNAAVAGIVRPPVYAVQYDSSAHTSVTLGGLADNPPPPVSLGNVANGVNDSDAINVAQLEAVGATIDSTGTVTNAFVEYDDSSREKVSLGGKGATAATLLTNVAAGTVGKTSHDAINGSQLHVLLDSAAATFGGGAAVNQNGTLDAPGYALKEGAYDNVGDALDAIDQSIKDAKGFDNANKYIKVVSVSSAALATGQESIAIGGASAASGNSTVAIGAGARASFDRSVALGVDSVATAANSLSVGSRDAERRIMNVADGVASTDAINLNQLDALRQRLSGLQASGSRSLLLAATADNADNADTVGDAVVFDYSDRQSVSLGSATGSSVSLTNVADGALSADSSDAVTGAQLYAANQRVYALENAVQTVVAGGPDFIAADQSKPAAHAPGQGSVAIGGGAMASGAQSVAVGDGATASAANSVALGANSVADRDDSVSVGSAGQERQIVRVAPGTEDTDAANVLQLGTTASSMVGAIGQQIVGLQGQVNTLQKNAYAGVASALAMPSMSPSGPGKTVVAAGGGTYMGSSAAALSITHLSKDNKWTTSGGVSVTSTGTAGGRVQVGYRF